MFQQQGIQNGFRKEIIFEKLPIENTVDISTHLKPVISHKEISLSSGRPHI